jgi:hypothetical protein
MRLIAFRRQWITLNDERRLELQTQINAQLPSVGGYEHEQMVAIHHRVQPLLTEYIKRRKMHRDADEFMQRDQLIANITDDINWLIGKLAILGWYKMIFQLHRHHSRNWIVIIDQFH